MAADMTSHIAGEAENTRERITATIDELQDRLNPRRLVNDAVVSVQQGGQDLIDQGIAFARAHPAAIAAAGLAVGLALLGTSRLKGARVNLGDESESYSDYDDDYQERADTGTERFALLRGTGSTVGDNPLTSVLVGIAAGALMGALFPATDAERRLLGETSTRFGAAARAAVKTARDEIATGRDKVADVTSHAKSAVQSVVDAAKDELQGVAAR